MSKRIAIVGGGYVGSELAKSLDDKADVTLIEQRSHFVHTAAMIRAVVDPTILDRALIPYDGLLKKGRVVQARAAAVDGEGVTLADGTRVDADYIVIATGSDYAAPFKASGADIEGLRAANADVHARLEAAQSVAIVGAGPVGTELAGEIAYAMPDKTVTLISSEPALFPQKGKRLGPALQRKLKAAGVKVVFGVRAENLLETTTPYSGVLELSDGSTLSADLIFPVIGARAVSDLLAALPGAQMGHADRIKTDHWMRPSTLPNVFAAGDAVDMGDEMTIVATSRQIPWLKKAFGALLDGGKLEDLKPYTPWRKAPILVPLGPRKGNSFLGAVTMGNLATSAMKGRDLFLTGRNKQFGRS